MVKTIISFTVVKQGDDSVNDDTFIASLTTDEAYHWGAEPYTIKIDGSATDNLAHILVNLLYALTGRRDNTYGGGE